MRSEYVTLFEECFPDINILNCFFGFLFLALEIFPSCIIYHRKFGMSKKGVFSLQSETREIV